METEEKQVDLQVGQEQKPIHSDDVWTPEEIAEMRKRMPKKLNKLGEWFFSNKGPFIVVVDPEAVYGK